jgi:D-aminoacyl-tRNA deacylase
VIGIVVSREDNASLHIGEYLLDLVCWHEERDESLPDSDGGGTVYRLDDAELRVFDDLHLHLDRVDKAFCGSDSEPETESYADSNSDSDSNSSSETDSAPDLIVFASRHAGETGPLLSAHVTGNFGPAEYGGHDGSLARAAPNAQATVFEALTEHAPEDYDVGLEGTHHGPTEIDTPSLFVELGSDEPQWNDPDGARAVAQAILALRGIDPDRKRVLTGFGGGHYVPRFERVVRETDWAVGHIGVDWALDAMGNPDEHSSLIQQSFEQSGSEYALIDGDHPKLERVIRDLGYRIVSETWARETTDIPLELVTRIEREIATVEDGLRFGEQATRIDTGDKKGEDRHGKENRNADGDRDRDKDEDTEDEFSVIDLPSDLLAEANGIDRERTLLNVRTHAVAVTTDEGGTRLAETIVLPKSADRNDLINALISVLETKYDTVERDGDRIAAHEIAFSPALAREAGVPEGPAFGRLSNGQDVEVDGTIVSPSDVRERQNYVFSLGHLSDTRQTSVER